MESEKCRCASGDLPLEEEEVGGVDSLKPDPIDVVDPDRLVLRLSCCRLACLEEEGADAEEEGGWGRAGSKMGDWSGERAGVDVREEEDEEECRTMRGRC